MVLGLSFGTNNGARSAQRRARRRRRHSSGASILSRCRIYVDGNGNVEVFLLSAGNDFPPGTTTTAETAGAEKSSTATTTYLSSSDDDDSAIPELNETQQSIPLEYSESETNVEEDDETAKIFQQQQQQQQQSAFVPEKTARANAAPPRRLDSNDSDAGNQDGCGDCVTTPSANEDDVKDAARSPQRVHGAIWEVEVDDDPIPDLTEPFPQLEFVDAVQEQPELLQLVNAKEKQPLDAQAVLRALLLLTFWVGQLRAAAFINNTLAPEQ